MRFAIRHPHGNSSRSKRHVLEQLISPMQLSVGHWQVPKASVTVSQSSVSNADVDKRLWDAVPVRTRDVGVVPTEIPPTWQDLIFQSENLQPTTIDGQTYFQMDEPKFKARFVTRQMDGQDHVVAAAVAVLLADGHWRLTQMKPMDGAADATRHLLPLPNNARRTLARFSNDRRLSAELVDVRCDSRTLLALWNRGGWEVRPSGFGGPLGFSYLCVRDAETIYAWSDDSGEAITRLMLVQAST
jgi:hypothetical protein